MTAPLITLMSDFGLQDPYVGIMRSRIALRAPQIPVIDLTHQIRSFAPEEAGYWLYCCQPQFPAGTVHVAVVDPGVGSARAILVLSAAGQYFIAPDNGLLGLLTQTHAEAVAYRVEAAGLAPLQLSLASATFHGRDVMAPLAAELASARVRPEQLGPEHSPLPGRLHAPVRRADGRLCGQVAVIDHYGNALTTIPAALVQAHAQVRLAGSDRPLRWVRTYAEAQAGECVALINSASMLEVATREGSAAALLNVRPGQEVYVSET
jgi:S-adenosylmethionine hydrolase